MLLELYEMVKEPDGKPWTKLVYRGEHNGPKVVLEFFVTIRYQPQYQNQDIHFQLESINFGDDCAASSMIEVMSDIASRLARGWEVLSQAEPQYEIPLRFKKPKEGRPNDS